MEIINKLFVFSLCLFSMNVQAAPKIEHWVSDQGAQVYYAHAPGLPIVDIEIVYNAGSARDGQKSGLASLTNHMLGMGAGGLDATQIAKRFEGVGAVFSNSAGRDMAVLKLRSLSQKKWLNPAIETLALIMQKPDFRKADFERERKRYLLSLKREKQSPASIAARAFYKAVYGNHPYAGMSKGTIKTMRALKRDDLTGFFKQYYVARNATVAIVGDLDKKAARKLINRLMKQVPSGQAAAPLPKVAALKQSKVIRIKHPSTQTHILMGQPGDYRGDPDYFVLYLGNHALGGSGLVSRLSEEIREKRGLSYSVYSYFSPSARKGVFQIGMQTRNDQVETGLKVLRKTVKDYIEKGMTRKEYEASLKNITGGFPLRIDSNKKILGYLAMIGFYKLPLTYLDDFNRKIESISLKTIHETMRRRLNPDHFVTVIVGGGK